MIPDEPLSAEQVRQMDQRDQDAADGIVVADSMVYLDRHALLNEVFRLRPDLTRAENDEDQRPGDGTVLPAENPGR